MKNNDLRFLLTLRLKRGSILPLNYQYPISSWIYKCINRADSDFARFLHQQGYAGTQTKRPFKFFTFSRLDVPEKEIYEDRLIIRSTEVYLTLSFLVEQAAEKFITGVFKQQHVGLGDKKSQVDFEVNRIETRPIAIRDQVTIQAHSPIVISKPHLTNSKMKAQFLSPKDEGYKAFFLQNLIRKYDSYATFTGNSVSPHFHETMDWQLASPHVKSSLQTIKAGSDQQTKVRGFSYRFHLTAPEPLMRIGLLAGFGEKNSLGFGFGESLA